MIPTTYHWAYGIRGVSITLVRCRSPEDAAQAKRLLIEHGFERAGAAVRPASEVEAVAMCVERGLHLEGIESYGS